MADAIGATLYVGNAKLKGQTTRERAPKIPDGMTETEIAEVLASTCAGSAECLASLALDSEIMRNPVHLAILARNLRTLAGIVDAGADALIKAKR
jgi:hypothetical protein